MGTSMQIRPIIAANWKMHGVLNGADTWLNKPNALADHVSGSDVDGVDCVLCPPATLLAGIASATQSVRASSGLALHTGAQDCHSATKGAHTGDISADMVVNAGARYVINGHSERRADHAESDQIVNAKASAAHAAGLTSIICIGETLGQREAGQALSVVSTQLLASVPEGANAENTVIAYEPIWAIGTGLTPTLEQIADIHDSIRAGLAKRFREQGDVMRIQYGGSVKPANAKDILALRNVNGALVGGAGLDMESFAAIIISAI